MKSFNLPCYDSHNSFYGKALVIEHDGEIYLRSYNTIVCKLDKSGHFRRLWGGYSATTMRHINSFLKHYNMEGGGKSWWTSQPVA